MKMRKTLSWLAVKTCFAAALWFGFWQGVDGAQYVVKFFVWAWCLPLGLIALGSRDLHRDAAKTPETGGRARKFINQAFAWATLGALVWTGHVVTAGAWAVWMFCAAATDSAVKRLREAQGSA